MTIDAAVRQLAERDAVPLARELQRDAVVHDALAAHPLADAGGVQQVDGALLQHAGADAGLDVLAAASLEHHRLDAGQVQQLREHEPGRAGADDRDLRAHGAVRRHGERSNSAAWPCPTPTQRVARP